MLASDIRRTFLEFFGGEDHTIVPSSSLQPDKDPTLLFVNAGMVQFKNVFVGAEKRPYSRATSCQKCVRAGGKHNDLENVGKTLRHHTFFEMLGNFSFGDYFKKEAIAYARELLLKRLNLDESRMYFTVFREDDEARAIWRSHGVPEDRIIGLGEKDNFWAMGEEGPCGPCSEIIYDLGPEVGCKLPTCTVGCDCDRFLEIWNLVFMQYERFRDGTMKDLPNPSVDTGMGLERVASLLQGKIGNYESDLFTPILKALEDTSGYAYGEREEIDTPFRVIADHVRGATFIINDGVLPSKEGRGYVLRRIMRRAIRYGKKIGIEREFLHDLSKVVVAIMEEAYPDVKNNHPYIASVLKGEEERFLETLSVGMRLYEDVKKDVVSKGGRIIPGDVVYRLYDTYGFPIDITEDMAREDNLVLDTEGFENALVEQRERSRADWKMKKEGWTREATELVAADARNVFEGYDTLQSEATILAIVREEAAVDEVREGDEGSLFFDVTPFYGESGGQVGDEGVIKSDGSVATVLDTARVRGDLFSHRIKVESGTFKKGQRVELTVDVEKRKSVARNHTATHLLQYALRTVLGDHVKQSGSLVDRDRLRFDFSHFQSLDPEQIKHVEDIVNEKILANTDVATVVKSKEDAVREGATALFEEKYGETVRVVRVGDFSMELCGGTHVRNTGEIGSFVILSEGSLAYGVRRIEAVTGKGAIEYHRGIEAIARSAARLLKSDVDSVTSKIESTMERLDALQKEMEQLKEASARGEIDEAIQSAWEKDGAKVVSMIVPGGNIEDLRKATDVIRGKVQSCVAIVGTKDESRGTLVVAVSKDLAKAFNAGQIMKKIVEKYGGKGGGNPQMAQGGVPAEQLAEALEYAKQVLGK
jgi:alanyl-tRNA synthetase